MATEDYRHLTYFFRLSLLIITVCGCEAANSTWPCPVLNSTTGAMLCCPSHESNTTHLPVPSLDEEEECVEILPITSASLLEEFWTIRKFNLARKERKNNASHHHFNESRDGTCCCKERVDFILPGMATTVSGSVSQVLQSSPGYVQPVSARMCKEVSCSRRTTGKKHISTCIQRWTATDLYIEDPVHDGFMRKESIKVPNGCDCRIPETDSSNKTIRAFPEKEKYPDKDFLELEDSIVTNIPTLLEPEYPHHLMGRNRSTLNHTSAGSNWHQYSNLNYADLPVGSSTKASQPHSSHTRDRVQHFIEDKQKDGKPTQNQSLHMNPPHGFLHHNSASMHEGPMIGASQMQDNANRAPNDNYYSIPEHLHNVPVRQGPRQTLGNYPNAALDTIEPQDRLRALNNLVSSPTLQPVNPQLVSNLNDLNTMMANYIKMGMMSTNPRAMSTTQIVENALTKVHSSQQMQALAMAERLMLLEIEHLRLSLSMAEMSFRQFDGPASSSGPKFPYVNDVSRENIPVIFQPGGLNGPVPVVIADSNKTSTFTGSSSNIASSQGNGASKPLAFGNPPVRGDLAMLTPNSMPLKMESSSLKPVTPLSRETPSFMNQETPPPKQELPPNREMPKPKEDTLTRNTSRVSVMDNMLEEELYSAFVDYLFQQAWADNSCMVPLTINSSQSELNFLPNIIKEKLDIRVGGSVDIHKFAARIIAGTITCRVQNLEAALLDGSLARVITGGIKVAEMLKNHIMIVKGLMRGLLDTDQAKGLVNILKWASRPTGSPAAEEFVSPGDAADIENTLSLVAKALKVYIDVFGSSINASLTDKKSGFALASLPQSVSTTTEAPNTKKNSIGPLRNIGIQPQDNMISLNASAVLLMLLNGTQPGMNTTVATMPSTKTTLSGFMIGSSVTSGFGAGYMSAMSRPEPVASVATSVTTSSTADTPKPVTSTTTTAVIGMNTTAAVVRGSTTTPPTMSITTTATQITRNSTMLSGSGIASTTTTSYPVTSRYDKYTTSKVGVTPHVHGEEVAQGGDSYLNKSLNQGKPTSYGARPDTTETKDTSRAEIEKYEPGYGDDDFVDKAGKKPDKSQPVASSTYKVVYGPGPEDDEGPVEYSPIDGSVLLPKEKQKNPDVLGNLPEEYDPLDLAPGSLMNLLFPNLR